MARRSAIGTYAGSPIAWTEDRQVFAVSVTDVLLPHTADGRARTPYQKWQVGATDWGEKATLAPDHSGSNWDCFYRDVGGNGIYGGVLAARLTNGAEAIWNRPETFKYYLETHWRWEIVNQFRARSKNPRRAPIPLYTELSNSYRATFSAPPSIIRANVDADVLWMTHDRMLVDDNTANPAAALYIRSSSTGCRASQRCWVCSARMWAFGSPAPSAARIWSVSSMPTARIRSAA